MVEFKGDLDSEHMLMEINPRFWGSLPFQLFQAVIYPLLFTGLPPRTAK